MQCCNCGAAIAENANFCTTCGAGIARAPYSQPPPPSRLGDDPGIRMLLPVGRSGWAIAAGYAGLLSPLLLIAPLAVFLGLVAIRDIRRNPHRHGMGRAVFGIVMGVIFSAMLLLMVIAAVSAAREV